MTEDRGRRTKDGERQWWQWMALGLIVLVAFGLRVYRLDAVSLRGDEAFTVVFVQRTWEGLWRGISTIEPNPPLMYLALRVWVAIAGDSEFVTRYFSVFFGVLCVPLLYRLARTMWTTRATHSLALWASVLIAINPYQIWHSQDVRNYTLWPCLSLLALVFLWRWWRSEISDWRFPHWSFVLRPLSLYVLATLLSLYTHYYDTFVVVAENVFVFAWAVWTRRTRTLLRWIGAQGVIVALYAPWVLFGTDRITTYGEGSAESGVVLFEVFWRPFASFVLSETVPADFRAIGWIPFALALVAILLALWRSHRLQATFLFLWVAVPTLALYLISLGRPLFLERYLNGIAPAYYLLFVIGLWQGSQLRVRFTSHITPLIGLGLFGALAAYALSHYYFDPAYAKSPDWRALMQYIKDHHEDGDLIIQNFTEMSPYYYRGTMQVLTVPKDFLARPSDEKNLRQFAQDYRRLWFIPASPDLWDPDQFVETFLSHHTERMAEIPIDIFRLQLYWTPRKFLPQMTRLDARVGAAKLVGYRAQGTRDLHLALYWQTDAHIETSWTVFAHVIERDGRVVAQHDGVPSFGRYPTTAWQPGELIVDVHTIRVEAAPSTYALVVGMYDVESLTRAPAFDANGARVPNDQILLTTITIP